MTLPFASIIIASLSFVVSATTAWLSLLRAGTVKMTRPTTIAFLDSRGSDGPKVYLRTLVYSTARRGQVIESMFVRLRRGQSHQTFNVWVYGEKDLARGSGLYVGHEGRTFNHHFVLPKDGTKFQFLPGDYSLEIFAALVNSSPLRLAEVQLVLSDQQAEALKDKHCAVFFDWGPDSGKYHAHIDRREPQLDITEALNLGIFGR
jgi:hypothetical protein